MKPDERQIHHDVARRFSAAASDYDRYAGIQRRAAADLVARIPGCLPSRILDLGCGTGVLTKELAAHWPAANITAIDIAPGMVETLKKGLPDVQAYVADISCLARNPVFDLVASNCALHWIMPFAAGILRMAGQLRPGGIAAVALMLDGTLRELHEARRVAAPTKAPPARMPLLEEVSTALRMAGLVVSDAMADDVTETLASPREVLLSLRTQGLTAGHLSRGRQPLTRGEMQRLEEVYRERFTVSGGVAVSYRVGYFVAAKPA